MTISVETFFLNPDAQGTLQAQIQQMIAEGILSGRFHRREKLPSTRKLARHLGISRITVTLAYTELQANDYLTSQGRSGFFVSDNAPVPPLYTPPQRSADRVDWTRAIARSFTGGDTPEKPRDWQQYRYPFIYGQADPTLFDHSNWRLCAVRALGQKDFSSLTADYFDQDDPLLVEFIARHTLPRRGITARPDEILITLGAQNARVVEATLGAVKQIKASEAARDGWREIARCLASEEHDFYVLDEFTYPLDWGWIDVDEVVSVLSQRPGRQHVIITGRRAPAKLIDAADLVTEMVKVKHPMDAGRKGQKGIEW